MTSSGPLCCITLLPDKIWIMRDNIVVQQRSPELVTFYIADSVLPARQGVATETLDEDEHEMRQWMVTHTAGERV